jgi:hypothetical protein
MGGSRCSGILSLGKKFEGALNRLIKILEHSPFFAIRYDEVHCLPMRKFPFRLNQRRLDMLNRVASLKAEKADPAEENSIGFRPPLFMAPS